MLKLLFRKAYRNRALYGTRYRSLRVQEDGKEHSDFTRQCGIDLAGLHSNFDSLEVMNVKCDEAPEEMLKYLVQSGSLKKI